MPIGIKFKTEAERKEGKRLASARYKLTEKGKQARARSSAIRAKYERSEEGKRERARYNNTEEGKQRIARYNNTEKAKQRRARYSTKYNKSEIAKQRRAKYNKSKKGKLIRAGYGKLDYLKRKDSPEYQKRKKATLTAWHKKNKEHFRIWHRTYNKRRKSKDPSFKIQIYLRSRINQVLKNQKAKKYYHFNEVIGCSPKELKDYLERKFRRGMSWENYSLKIWHIDHIIACSKFDLTKEEEQRKCFHFSNLQPLWAKHNLQKGSR